MSGREMISNENVMFTNVYRRINQTLGRDVMLLILPLNDKRHVTYMCTTNVMLHEHSFSTRGPGGGCRFPIPSKNP
jgi:hypothetical protein